MPNINLKTSDGVVFNVDVQIAMCSGIIKTMLENLGIGDENEVIPLPNVHSSMMTKVIEWATHHKDDYPENHDQNQGQATDDISTWDAEFLNVDQSTLFEFIMAANYLDIKSLLDTACKTVAKMLKDKTPEEIRNTFNIQNDFTSSDEEDLRWEREWYEKK